MASISVYLGANKGKLPGFTACVETLGQLIAKKQHHLIYGGSSLGLMGILAQRVLSEGGRVTGIISESLVDKEMPPDNLSELIVTKTIQERKRLLQARADAFMILPGGIGTFEEMFETWNAIKIGTYKKPMVLFNYHGYFEQLIAFINECAQHGFLTQDAANIPAIAETPEALFSQIN